MSSGSIQHEFICIDEGLGTLLHVNEREPARNWRAPIGHPEARDMQLIGNNRVLIGHHHGYSEFDIATGRVVKEFKRLTGVTAARRQPNGNTIIAGVNLAATAGSAGIPAGMTSATGVVILELDTEDREIHRAVFPGDYVRLIRQTEQGTYLMCCNDRIREGSREGNYLREFPVDGFYHAWKAVRLASGHLIVSAGYGAFLVELDASGKIVRTFGRKDSVPPEVNPFFYAMFQLLPNGHVVLANWQGHGDSHGKEGVQLLEFNARAEIVWQWSRSEMISSLQGVLVLDGLDTSRLHDERHGLVEPVSGRIWHE